MTFYTVEVIRNGEVNFAVTIAEEEEEVRDQLVAWGFLPDERRYDTEGVKITPVTGFTRIYV